MDPIVRVLVDLPGTSWSDYRGCLKWMREDLFDDLPVDRSASQVLGAVALHPTASQRHILPPGPIWSSFIWALHLDLQSWRELHPEWQKHTEKIMDITIQKQH